MRKQHKILLPLLIAVLLYMGGARAGAAEERIANGIWMGDVDLSGMTVEEARSAVDSHLMSLVTRTFSLNFTKPEPLPKEGEDEQPETDDEPEEPTEEPSEEQPEAEPEILHSVTVLLTELHVLWDVDKTLENASTLGQTGRLIERYKVLQDMAADHVELPVSYTVDEEAVRRFVEDRVCLLLNQEAQNAKLEYDLGSRVITPEINGTIVNVEATINAMLAAFDEELTDNMSALGQWNEVVPTVTAELLDLLRDDIGHCRTNFILDSDRGLNILHGASMLNNMLLMPGDQIALDEMFLPYDAEHGWLKAGSYANGGSVDVYGGGVCQIASTLYGALLEAELQIDRRYNHSQLVTYCDPSMDATLATGSKDLVFTNNLNYPVLITSRIDDGMGLVFQLFSVDERPKNRTIEYVSDTTSEGFYYQKADNHYYYFPDRLFSTSYTDADTHPRVYSRLLKNIYIDGVLVETQVLSKDYYQPVIANYYIGTLDILCNEEGVPIGLDGQPIDDGRHYADNYIFLEDLVLNDDGTFYQDEDGHYVLKVDFYVTDDNGHFVQDAYGDLIKLSDVELDENGRPKKDEHGQYIFKKKAPEENP